MSKYTTHWHLLVIVYISQTNQFLWVIVDANDVWDEKHALHSYRSIYFDDTK